MFHPPSRRPVSARRRRLVVEALEHRLQPSAGITELPPPTDLTATVSGPLPLTVVDVPTYPGPASVGTSRAVVAPTLGESTSVRVGPPRHELYLVAFDVPDRDALVRDLLAGPGFTGEVVELGGRGLTEVTAILQDRSDLDAVHLITHGAAGSITLGPDVLDAATLPLYSSDLRTWGAALAPGGDLLLYGCDVAADGGAFATALGELTWADVAASTNRTGTAAAGGDWVLEYATGPVESRAVAAGETWQGSLGLSPASGEARVNQVTTNLQENLSTAVRPDGTVVAAWDGFDSGTLSNVYARLLDRSGNPLTAAFQVNQTTTTSQTDPAVAADGAGNFVVAWIDRMGNGINTSSVVVRVYDAGGTPVTGEVVVESGQAVVTTPDVAFDGAGNFVVVWNRQGAGAVPGIFAQQFTGTGTPRGGVITVQQQSSAPVDDPSTAVAPDGRFVVTWTERGSGQTTIRGQRFDAAGTGQGVFDVQTSTNNADVSRVGIDASGAFVVAWCEQYADTATSFGVLVRRFAADGTPLGAPVLANQTTAGDQTAPAVAVAPGGAFVVSWQSALQDGSGSGVYLRPFAADGTPAGSEQLVNGTTAGDQTAPQASINSLGNISVGWQGNGTGDADGVFARSFSWPEAGNRPPTATADGYTTAADNSLVVPRATGLLSNDADPDGDPLVVVSYTQPGSGAVTVNPDGSFTYTPPAGFVGTDSFTYTVADGRGGSAVGTVTVTVAPNANLLFATKGDVTGAGTSGLTTWGNTQVLQMGGSNFAVEPGTSGGTVSSVLDLGRFGGGSVGVDALHFVRHRLTVGSGAASLTLQAGDLLLSVNNSATLTGSSGSLAVTDDEVFVFRPATLGDYTAGSFTMVLDNFASISGSSKTWAVTVAEADVLVGDYLVRQGTFLYTREGGSQDDQIALFTPTGAGAGRTAGTTAVLIDGGADLGMGPPIRGLDLVEAPAAVAGRTLAAGTLVLALDNSATVGTNRLGVTVNDVFTLSVTRTTLVAGQSAATASLLFQGADAGLSGSNAKFAAVSLGGAVGNTPPVLGVEGYATAEDTPLSVPAAGLLGNDADPDGDPLAVVSYTQPAHGAVTVAADGSFTYTPAADYNGPDSFTYTVSDGRDGTATGTVGLTVAAVNDPPVAADDHYSTLVNLLVLSTPLTVSAPGVLGNDTDADGYALLAELVTGPAGGLLSFNADGSFTYTAFLNFTGPDTFTYRVFDGAAYSAPATVYVNVSAAPNQAPAAAPDGYSTAEDTPLTVAAPGLLGNDSDPDGDTLAVVVDTGPAHGTLVLHPGGGFTYTPAGDWSGTDSFTYHATDGSLDSATVGVTLTVTAVDDPPTLDPLADATVAEDSGDVTVSLTGVGAGGGESQPLTVTATSSDSAVVPNPTVAYASPAATGTLTFRPAADANGTATITVTVDDGVTTTTRTFVVTVTAVNDAPVAGDATDATSEDTPVVVGVLGTDTDSDGDTLTVTGTGPAGHGTVTTDGTTVTYTPAADWFGSDSFTYTVSDGNGGTATATVAVAVTPVNDAPVATDDGFTTQQNTPLAVSAAGVLGNDSDVEGDTLAAVQVTNPAHGTLTLNPDGSFLYTPDVAFTGTDRFTYQASDGTAWSQPATVLLRVLPPPVRPVGADDAYTILAGQTLTVPAPGVLANDTPSGSAALTAMLVSPPDHGTVALGPDGSFTYTPDAAFVGTDSFNYKASDAGGETGTAHVTIQVIGPNRAPSGAADAIATVAGQPVVLTAAAALANDSDPDGDSLSTVLVGGAANGTVTVAADGSFTYTSDAGFSGTDTFTYRVTDGQLVSGLVQVTVTVAARPTPEPPSRPDDPPTSDPVPPTVPQPPAVDPGTPVATPAAPAASPVATDTPSVSFAPSTSVSVAGPGATDDGPLGTIRPVPTVPTVLSGTSTPSPRTDTPSASDAGRFYPVADGPAATAPVPPEAAPPPAPAAPQPAPPVLPTPVAPSPPPAVVVLPPSVVLAAPVVPAPATTVILPDTLLEPLDRIRDELRAESAERATTDSIVVAGGVAVAGTVLLNTRAVYWFLSALLARPAVWRRYDPLDVLYAWERDKDRGRDAGPDDSLQSMVG